MKVPKTDVRRFRSHLRSLERIVNAHSKRCCSQVSQSQCHVLLRIHDSEGCTTKDLAELLRLDASTISRTVDGLVRLELVVRAENPDDRRSIILRVTKKGRDLSEWINADADRYFGEVLENIPSRNRTSVLKSFEVIVDSIIKTERNDTNTSSCCDCSAGGLAST